jgi:hypothetical protein
VGVDGSAAPPISTDARPSFQRALSSKDTIERPSPSLGSSDASLTATDPCAADNHAAHLSSRAIIRV